jgi:O-antigen/teichoic acid export membrane protein
MKIISKFISGGTKRTQVIKKNVIGSFGVKGISIATTLLLVPLTIRLLSPEKYGIWITIFSIVTWFTMMDVGIGNGFRNKFAEATAKKNKELAKEYIQTLYSAIGLISLSFLLVFTVINPFLNWHVLLNLPVAFDENISLIIWAVFALFCVQLWTKNISTILLSLQKTALSNLLILWGNIGSLVFIFILQRIGEVSLFSIALAFMSAPILVFLIASYLIFNGELKEYKPKLFVLPHKKYLKDLAGLGLKFFFIQVATIFVYAFSNIIVIQLYGPAEVTPYNVASRLFFAAQGVFTIIITPFWAAFTEANAKKDFYWINKSIRNLIAIWGLFSSAVLILWLTSPLIYTVWIGEEVIIPLGLSFQFALYTIILSWTTIFMHYINGVGRIKLQLFIVAFQCIISVPLAILFAKYFNFGTTGVILAININLFVPAIFIPIQYKKLITNKAQGIWLK